MDSTNTPTATTRQVVARFEAEAENAGLRVLTVAYEHDADPLSLVLAAAVDRVRELERFAADYRLEQVGAEATQLRDGVGMVADLLDLAADAMPGSSI